MYTVSTIASRFGEVITPADRMVSAGDIHLKPQGLAESSMNLSKIFTTLAKEFANRANALLSIYF
jgi:hypothetical protein